jgi:hypothetical protein
MMLYLSRAFVEFGPFPSSELLSFHQRGILKETDYVRLEGSDEWLHVEDWAAQAKPAPAPATKKPAVKKAKAETPPAKKAAVKKAKKTA